MKKYMCMKCKKVYDEDDLPIIDEFNQRGDGCCTIGSLIEYYGEYKTLVEIYKERISRYIKEKDEKSEGTIQEES